MGLTHFKQRTNVTCGAAAYRIALSDTVAMSEKQACDEVNTTKTGTYLIDSHWALQRRGMESYYVNIDLPWNECEWWLAANSQRSKIILSYGNYGKTDKGRTKHYQHAITIYKGLVYCPSEDEPIAIEAFATTFINQPIVRAIVLIPTENR